MSEDIEYKRSEIAKIYPGEWKERVKRMPDHQVAIIFRRFQETGKFDDYYKAKKKKAQEPEQLSFL